MIIIADSGSTKTTWYCLDQAKDTHFDASKAVNASGINPVRDDEQTIRCAVQEGLKQISAIGTIEAIETIENLKNSVNNIYFYGSGCIEPYSGTVRTVLKETFPKADIQVESDMLGAAIALCGHGDGIACILGTGSNSCLFDGEKIVQQTPALGYIIGDEGSGASLGKHLVGDVLKQQLPEHICHAFHAETGLDKADIINRVYRQPGANTFLASLTPFLARHIDDEAVNHFVVDEFRRFIVRNIRAYQRPDLPIHFVGGLTATFLPQLRQAIEAEGMLIGQYMARPIEGMVEYFIHA